MSRSSGHKLRRELAYEEERSVEIEEEKMIDNGKRLLSGSAAP